MEPQYCRHAQGKPRAKQCTQKSQEVAEDGYGRRDDPRQYPRDSAECNPATPSPDALLRHDGLVLLPVPPDTDEHVLGNNGSVDNPGDDNGRHSDSPCDLGDNGAGGRERRRRHVVADISVDYHGDGNVEAYCDRLQKTESLGKVGWGLHLGNEAEEGDVAGVSNYYVAYGNSATFEGCLGRRGDGVSFGV